MARAKTKAKTKKPAREDELITEAEAARILGLNRKTLADWRYLQREVRAGRRPSRAAGHKPSFWPRSTKGAEGVRYRRSEIERRAAGGDS